MICHKNTEMENFKHESTPVNEYSLTNIIYTTTLSFICKIKLFVRQTGSGYQIHNNKLTSSIIMLERLKVSMKIVEEVLF